MSGTPIGALKGIVGDKGRVSDQAGRDFAVGVDKMAESVAALALDQMTKNKRKTVMPVDVATAFGLYMIEISNEVLAKAPAKNPAEIAGETCQGECQTCTTVPEPDLDDTLKEEDVEKGKKLLKKEKGGKKPATTTPKKAGKK